MKMEYSRGKALKMYDFIQKFDAYNDFVNHTERVAFDVLINGVSDCGTSDRKSIDVLLNGANAKAVSVFLNSSFRKENGVFFTGQLLANKVATRIKAELQAGSRVLDPACGSGDLLLACARYMSRKRSLSGTIKYWSSLLYGFDIYPDFVRSARLRLALLTASHCQSLNASEFSSKTFHQIIHRDFFDSLDLIDQVDCIITNPPFGRADLTGLVDWASGTGQVAGLYIDRIITHAKNGQKVVAVLPDVLRSGSRYANWRRFVKRNSRNLKTEIYGRFNNEADVDVFILDFTVDKTHKQRSICDRFGTVASILNDGQSLIVADKFKVSVGPVVPHRDVQLGSIVPYVDVKGAPLQKEFVPSASCGYQCTLKTPPFVIFRRTSSPGDLCRVKASIVKGSRAVAVENHLIVLEPKDGNLKTCRHFLKLARGDQFSILLNEAIRCRHLTVRSIKELPWS